MQQAEQNGAVSIEPGHPPALRRRHRRPRVLWLADRRGWAYDREGRSVQRALAGTIDVEIAFVQEGPDLARLDFDLLVVAFWGETYHQRFGIPAARVVKQVASHRWQNEAAYGCLSAAEFAAKHLADAGSVCAISQRLVDALAPVRTVTRVGQSVDTKVYARARPRDGALVFGWAGNAGDPCKGLRDVLVPAAGGTFPLRIAGGHLDAAAMVEFYRGIDVLCIASTAEGEPLPLLEGMASGCFAIATDVGIVPELIRHGENGLVVERTPTAFAQAMQWCCDHAEHVRAAGMANILTLEQAANEAMVRARWRPLLLDALARLRLGPPAASSNPVPAAPSGAVARAKEGYAAHYGRLNGGQRQGADLDGVYEAAAFYYRAELDPVLPRARAGDHLRALDVGCGYGLLLRFLRAHGFAVVDGIELDADLKAIALDVAGDAGTVWHGDALAVLPSLPAAYDVVTAFDIVEHFDKDGALALLTRIRGVLAPSGCAVVRTPNMANVLGTYSRCMDITHQVGFTEQSLRQVMQLAGFARIELVEPHFPPGHELSAKLARSRTFHRELFELQDRSMPRCFDKNVVMIGHA